MKNNIDRFLACGRLFDWLATLVFRLCWSWPSWRLWEAAAKAAAAKCLNADTVTWNERFQPRITPALSSPSNPSSPAAWMMIDLFVTDCRKQPLIFQYFYLKIIYSCNHGDVFPWAVGFSKTGDNIPRSLTRQITCNECSSWRVYFYFKICQ